MNIAVPNGWSLVEFIDLVDTNRGGIRRGPFGGAVKKEIFVEDGFKVYEQKNAIYNDFSIGSYFIDDEKYKELKTFAVKPDDLIVSCSGTLGRVAIVPPTAKAGIINQALMRITPNQQIVSPTFLKILLETPQAQQQLFGSASGSAIKNVKPLAEIKASKLAVPSIEEQRRIVGILARADRLRQLRRYALQLSDGYLQSVFLQMFGDPVTNSKGLPTVKFGDVCKSRLGKMLDQKQQTGKHLRPYLRNVNVQWGKIDLTDVQEMDFLPKDREIFRLRKGDVLICEGGEVGRSAIWNDEMSECYYQKALHRARPNPELAVPEFILWLMYSLAHMGGLGDFTSQVTIAHLTGVKLKTIEFPLPSLREQKKFANICRQFEQLRIQQREALRQADHLFATLLHRAFRGEL